MTNQLPRFARHIEPVSICWVGRKRTLGAFDSEADFAFPPLEIDSGKDFPGMDGKRSQKSPYFP